ncbi:MAG: cupin domain-containing protein [Chloroflexota bacterium]
MAHAGKIILNRKVAGTVKFLKTAADTGGGLLEMEATFNTAVNSIPEHSHPNQDEHIEVLAGMVSIEIDGQERTYFSGESFDFPRNVPHRILGAAGSEEAQILWQIRPALDSETFIETVCGLEADGKMEGGSVLGLCQTAVIYQSFHAEYLLTKPSQLVQKIMFGILAPIGRLLGYQARYEKYSGPKAREDMTIAIPSRE